MSNEFLDVLNYLYVFLSQIIFAIITIALVTGAVQLRRYLLEKKLKPQFNWAVWVLWFSAAYVFFYQVVFPIIMFIVSLQQQSSAGQVTTGLQ